ncbi:MAG: hypothetical protein JXB48_11065 [Candidatus Latescibacteria bacterium]|nr:hypothetical protein [Candidatus Latescibacterota bacterium]
MNATQLLDHLSLFENLIVLSPEELIRVLQPYIVLFTNVGRFLILLMFIIHLTSRLVLQSFDEFKQTLLPDVYKLVIIMALFGNAVAYGAIVRIAIGLFSLMSDNVLQAQFVVFKGGFRSFIDAIADGSLSGIDFFNVQAMSASVFSLMLSIAVIMLLVTYYTFVSAGMFELLIILAVGPAIAGFLFFLKTPLHRWFNAIFACMLFPVISAVAVTIINQAALISTMEEHLVIGSLFTLFIQIIIGIVFLDLTLLFHAAFFGVSFINIPVIIKSAILALFGNFHAVFLNYGFILSTRKRGI